MTELYAEWKKLKDNVQSVSARLYYEKNENTENKYEEALERLAQFEKENGIPLMADEADVKKMFCPQTTEEWLRSATFEELAGAIYEWHTKGYARGRLEVDLNPITEVVEWLKQPHTQVPKKQEKRK